MATADPVTQAHLHLDAGQVDTARQLLDGVLAADPQNGAALLVMAAVRARSGDFAGAEQSARLATAVPETRAPGLFMLARAVSLDPRRLPEARDVAAEAVRLDPENWSYRDLLGEVLVQLGDHAAAVAQAEYAVRLAQEPDDRAAALRGLAFVLGKVPQRAGHAYQVAQQAVALDPTEPAGHAMLAMTQLRLQRPTRAVLSSLAALRDDPTAVLPPVLIKVALYLLIRRAFGYLLLVAWLVPMICIGVGSEVVDIESENALLGRIAGAAGLLGFALVLVIVFRPISRPSVRRAAWRTGKQCGWFVAAVVYLAIALLGYLLALAFGWLLAVPPVAFWMIIVWYAHGAAVSRLRFPAPASLPGQRS